MKKTTISDIQKLKDNKKPFATITAYDYLSAKNVDSVDIPLILVGDSAAMVVYGMDNTIPISMDEMMFLVKAVCRGAKKALIVADMPFMSYQASIEDAVRNAGRFIKEGGAAAIKLEGGIPYISHVQAIIDAGIPVMGHVGLLPQSYHLSSGYRIQGKSNSEAEKIIQDAQALQSAGVFSIVLEGIPGDLAKKITKGLNIPTIGIGAGPDCDGQIQVYHDILGLYDDFIPKHTKRFGNLFKNIQDKLIDYKNEVQKMKFPDKSHFINSNTEKETLS